MSNNGALVNLGDLMKRPGMTVELARELTIVQSMRNQTPTEKVNREWVPSPTNIALMEHTDFAIRKISSMVDQGLTFANDDYYIYASFSGTVKIVKAPNGMIRSITTAAAKSGYMVTINLGCVFTGPKQFEVTRNGYADELHLVNDPAKELDGGKDDIVAPFAVITLLRKGLMLSRKVTIVRRNEYLNARKQSKSSIHDYYPVPLAQKTALYRAGKELLATLGISDGDDSDDNWSDVKQDLRDHEDDHDMSAPAAPAPAAPAPVAPVEPEAEKPQPVTDEWFKGAYPEFQKIVEKGTRTPDELLESLKTKCTLNDKQIQAIKNLEDAVPPPKEVPDAK